MAAMGQRHFVSVADWCGPRSVAGLLSGESPDAGRVGVHPPPPRGRLPCPRQTLGRGTQGAGQVAGLEHLKNSARRAMPARSAKGATGPKMHRNPGPKWLRQNPAVPISRR